MCDPSENVIRAWTRLIRAHRAAYGGVEADLKRAGLPPLAWYDALLELRRAPDGVRPLELEQRMLIAQYSVSRLVDRLEAAGYLAKTVDPDDARGRVLRLTPEGEALLKRMWPVYAAAVSNRIGAALDAQAAATLASLLERIIGRNLD